MLQVYGMLLFSTIPTASATTVTASTLVRMTQSVTQPAVETLLRNVVEAGGIQSIRQTRLQQGGPLSQP